MKIVISATGPTLDSEVDPRFGRCHYFIIVDPETMRFDAVDNASAAASGGAGISAAQAVAGKGIDVVLTGDCGPKAYQALTAAGIKVVTGASRKVQDVIAGYKQGDYTTAEQASTSGHLGMGGGHGSGGGFGRGSGRIKGRRRGK